MHIDSIEITNYKSFANSEIIQFEPGINLIVGPNNSGKTALLEVINMSFSHVPFKGGPYLGDSSRAIATIKITPEDVRAWFTSSTQFILPLLQSTGGQNDISIAFGQFKKARDLSLTIEARLLGEGSLSAVIFKDNLQQELGRVSNAYVVIDRESGRPSQTTGLRNSTIDIMLDRFVNKRFFFNSERLNVHTTSLGMSTDLAADARNLAEVLHNRHNTNARKFHENYLRLVSRVLPNVRSVSPELTSNQLVSLKIWTRDQSPNGPEISFPLEHCGTGVGQVLAILYVIVYADPSVIMIDEPNSFLHPGATRELLRIFKENLQHQYFISTHSPEVFTEVRPPHFTRLRYEDYQTKAERATFGDLADTFQSLGISPFYERTIWVEGETEVDAFQYVLGDSSSQFFKLFSVSDVVKPSSMKKEIDRLIGIYQNMVNTHTSDPSPSVMQIVVDGEHLNGKVKEDYERRPDKLVRFLPRKMFENYLLDPEAIAAALEEETGRYVLPVEVEEVIAESQGAKPVDEWLKDVHGARLLESIFAKYDCAFIKTKHSVAITRWLSERKPTKLAELKEFLNQL